MKQNQSYLLTRSEYSKKLNKANVKVSQQLASSVLSQSKSNITKGTSSGKSIGLGKNPHSQKGSSLSSSQSKKIAGSALSHSKSNSGNIMSHSKKLTGSALSQSKRRTVSSREINEAWAKVILKRGEI